MFLERMAKRRKLPVLAGPYLLKRPGRDKLPRYNFASFPWGCSSVGRALQSHCRGRGFESHHLHHTWPESMMKVPLLFGILVAALAVPAVAFAQKPTPLFGKDLSGWVKRGGNATYAIEGNEIVGTSVLNSPNTFLCTERTYGDFILEYDFKVDPRLNSGVQIRSECFDQATKVEWNGKSIDIPAGRVHGYQIEIDPEASRDRWWTGGIYDEGRRGWLYPGISGGGEKAFTDRGRKLFKQGAWNHVRVEAVGDSIHTWLNGKPCAAIRDDMTLRGFIALQVHTIGNDVQKNGTQVRWRNLKITDLTPPPNTLTTQDLEGGWRLLWVGKSTKGWRSAKAEDFPAKGWEIKDGELTVLPSGGAESAA